VNHALNKFLTVLHFIGVVLYEKLCFDILWIWLLQFQGRNNISGISWFQGRGS
jgi:hypothetical protein